VALRGGIEPSYEREAGVRERREAPFLSEQSSCKFEGEAPRTLMRP
jgi:hypothetical protein